jgi:3-methyladenine DNA glycosylase/8-oxoguanine DNA glycosylase
VAFARFRAAITVSLGGVPLETTIAPVRPYSLALSARMRSDATRFLHDGVLTLVYEAGGEPALARVSQSPDGLLHTRIESREPEQALVKLRFILAADDDHSEFLHRFRDDPLIGQSVQRLAGMRPIRTATVVHALLKAVCGQLIEAKAARLLEARLVRLASPEHEGLRLPPQRDTFQRFTRAELARHGLVSRKASALLRLTKELDLERLHGVPTEAAARRIERERGLGPWTAGVVCLQGLGRYEHGLVGDLGLVKLISARRGRWVETEETRELLEPYGEWAGLASIHLLSSVKDYSVGRSVGKRITSRIVSRPVSSMESLSMPRPRPAVGGIP